LVRNRAGALLLGQAGFLFALDTVTNVIDYVFHVYLGRVLVAGDFAAVQALNAALLIVITTSAVMQPVLARYVAIAAAGDGDEGQGRTIFQWYFSLSTVVGLGLTGLIWLGRRPIAGWLNVPPAVVAVGAGMVLLSLLRPVVAGVLQGQQRFVAFGVSRAVFAAGRLALAVLFIGLGGQVVAVVATMPMAALLALLVGLAFLGRGMWRRGPAVSRTLLWDGLRLSAGTFVAFAANTALQSNDVIWVNRAFAAEMAGAYAGAVLLRRALALLPGAVVVIFFPRVVATVAQKRLPDRLLLAAMAATLLPTLLLTGMYAAAGPWIVRLAFAGAYSQAGPWLGWLGVAALGYILASIWLNLFLATRPLPFIVLLAGTAVGQVVAFSLYHERITQVIGIFTVAGWLVAIGGGVLYLFWLRPKLVLQSQAVTV
jgi:O-antigen/teichoic acid export membrane protein